MRTYFFGLRILACLVVFFAVFGLSCRRKSPDQTDVNQAEPNITVETPAGDIAVTVNGVHITEAEIEELIKPQLDAIAEQVSKLPPAFAEQYKKQLRREMLERLIVGRLLDEKVKEANTVVTEEEVISQIREIASTQKPPLSLEDYEKILAKYGRSFDQVKQQVRKMLAYQRIMEGQWAGKINVTEDDAEKFYDANPDQFDMPEQVRASHILITPDVAEPNVDPNDAKARAKAKIQELLEQIKDGADFAELAKANSACPSAPQGGDLDFFPKGRMAPPFEEAAFELEIGKVSDIVETSFGYHIIKVTDRKDAGVISFEQAKDDIMVQLTQEKQSEFEEEYIESLKAEANIVYPPGKDPLSVTRLP